MFEKIGMSKKLVERLDGANLPTAPHQQSEQSSWSRPRLVKLQPGTAEHERAKIAFELLKSKKDDQAEPQA